MCFMMPKILNRFSLLFILLLSGCVSTKKSSLIIYEGFGDYQRQITTQSSKAQAYFDQGMQLMYGFNHDEAIRSFKFAAKIDPEAAMPWWGRAYSHGININDPAMTEERSRLAREAADKALLLLGNASKAEVSRSVSCGSATIVS